ncbi:hypothetical protein Tco_0503465 [Tanacetum coccineum]
MRPVHSYLDDDTDVNTQKSMPGDEIELVFGLEAAESDDEKNDKPKTKVELSKSEEATADNVLDELADMATNMNASVDKLSMLDPVVPRMVANAFKERMHDLLFNTLKNILTQIIEEFVKQAILNTLENNKHDGLQTTMTKAIKPEQENLVSVGSKREQNVSGDSLNTTSPSLTRMMLTFEEQSSKQAPSTTKPVPPVSTALVVHSSEEKPTKDEPPFKRLSKGKAIAFKDDPSKHIMPFLEQSRSSPKLIDLNQFSTFGEGNMTLDEAKA